jgi:hypothetical protein
MNERGPVPDLDALIKESAPAIKGIIRRKLRVTLDPADGRADNQDALELFNDVAASLAVEFNRLDDASRGDIRDFGGYAAVVTYNACHDYIRGKYPHRYGLKTRLRYFLSHRDGFSVWRSDEEMLCGFASWAGRGDKAAADRLARLRDDASLLGRALPRKDVALVEGAEWERFFDAVFKWAEQPVELDELVNVVADLFGVRDERQELEESAGEPATHRTLEVRDLLRRLWDEIRRLRPLQRAAYLLNFTDADGDLVLFPWHGIASVAEIGHAVELSGEQFEKVLGELPLSEAERNWARAPAASPERKFAVLWAHLPLDDLTIARLLGGTQKQVAKLRWEARERLKRQLRAVR